MGAHVKRARHVGTALLAAIWSLAVATPAMAQDHAGDPDRPLATRQALETAAGQLEAKGDSQRAAAIRARLVEGDFQPGDRVLLRVDSEPALSDTFTVTPGRTLALPAPVNRDVPLRGVLRSELEPYVAEQLTVYLQNPAVRARALVRVSVQGGVVRPGYYALPADALLSDALMAAGGTLPVAKPGKMRLERNGERVLDRDAFARAVAQGRTLDQLNVQDGDEVVVPREGGDGIYDHLRFMWVVISIAGGIVGLTKIF